jgi:hypothetical protein
MFMGSGPPVKNYSKIHYNILDNVQIERGRDSFSAWEGL